MCVIYVAVLPIGVVVAATFEGVVAVECDPGSQEKTLRAGKGADRAIIEAVDPRHGRPVVEAHHKLSLEKNATRSAGHDAHKIGAVRRRYEIDCGRGAGLGLEFGFEDEGAGNGSKMVRT
jgi:hypothetical protein